MKLVAILRLAVAFGLAGTFHTSPPVRANHPTCVVGSITDGDTFVCTDGTRVRMLQINAQELSDCGGQWAKAALRCSPDPSIHCETIAGLVPL